MSTITLDPEAYGSFARFSAVADFLELAALRTKRLVREPDLARRLEQDEIRMTTPLVSAEDPVQAAGIVFGLLLERARILCAGYPFSVTRAEGLMVSRRARALPYRVLLALTAAHAYRVQTLDPKKLFEGWVSRALQSTGLLATTTGTSRPRGRGGFATMIQKACDEVSLHATLDDAVISTAAQDEKVDTLAHLDFGCGRPGRWTFIGQATLAKSGEWERKLAEPKPPLWKTLVGEEVPPSAFLAVPHHVEPRHLKHLQQRGAALVLDRLRLARSKIKIAKVEREVVAAVQACRVEW